MNLSFRLILYPHTI